MYTFTQQFKLSIFWWLLCYRRVCQ